MAGNNFEETKKLAELFVLKVRTGDDLVIRFMNDENGNMIDEKIKVCKRLINGEVPADIENYYDVLDDMPKDDGNIITNW